jgi:hypothetical protein
MSRCGWKPLSSAFRNNPLHLKKRFFQYSSSFLQMCITTHATTNPAVRNSAASRNGADGYRYINVNLDSYSSGLDSG